MIHVKNKNDETNEQKYDKYDEITGKYDQLSEPKTDKYNHFYDLLNDQLHEQLTDNYHERMNR